MLIVTLIAVIEFTAVTFYYPKWENKGTEAVISWDVSGYYMYLPAIFVYHDLKKCSFQNELIEKYGPCPDFQQAFLHSSGNYVMKYSSGQAIILSPAFFAAHAYCKITQKYPADGFSTPYQIAVAIWSLFISVFGLLLLRMVLLYYFTDGITAVTLFAVALCSNYFEYATFSGPMTHNSLFTLYALLLWLTIRFYESPQKRTAIAIGALCGLAAITRPTETISLLIPLFWGIGNLESLRRRKNFFQKNLRLVVMAGIAFALMASIQIGYWKYVSGEWLVYSYQKQGFDWFQPHIWNCLFSPKAGWLLYSPVMAFALAGFYFLYKEKRILLVSCLVFVVPFTYMCFSWSEWWYGWSVGQRAMVQSYPIFAIPMAMCFTSMASFRWARMALTLFLFLFLLYNLWVVHQSHRGALLRGPEMNGTYLWAILGRWTVDDQTMTLLDNTEYLNDPQTGQLIYENNFNNDTSANAVVTGNSADGRAIRVNKELQTTAPYFLDEDLKKGKWYKVTADFSAKDIEWDMWHTCEWMLVFYDHGKEIKRNHVHVFRLIKLGRKKTLHFYARAPRINFDNAAIQLDNLGSDKEVVMDELKVYLVE